MICVSNALRDCGTNSYKRPPKAGFSLQVRSKSEILINVPV
jgi:hypothetical protein